MASDWIAPEVARYEDVGTALAHAFHEVIHILADHANADALREFDAMSEQFTIPPGLLKVLAHKTWKEALEESSEPRMPGTGTIVQLFTEAYEEPVTGDPDNLEGPASAFTIAWLLGALTAARTLTLLHQED